MGNESDYCPMSLKVFHIIFTGCTSLLLFFLGVLSSIRYSESGDIIILLCSISSFGLTAGGIYYGKNFIQKYKHLSNL